MRTALGLGLRTAVVLSVLILVAGNAQSAPATSSNGGTTPVKKIYRCAGQLTRAAEVVITMQAGKAFYQATDSTVLPPATGMDVYRVLTRPSYKGALIDSVIFVEYESMR